LFKSLWSSIFSNVKQVLCSHVRGSSSRNTRSSIFRTSQNNRCNRNNIRVTNNDIESKKERKGFFSAKTSHSKEIGKIISDAFGTDSHLIGECQYVNGKLERQNPHFSAEDIQLGEDHLEEGYSETWAKKQELQDQILKLYDEIENTMKAYEERIRSLIPDKFQSKIDYDSDYVLRQPTYYEKPMYGCIFEQINKSLNGMPFSDITNRHGDDHKIKKIINGKEQDQKPTALFVEPRYLVDGEEIDLQEFRKIFESLRSDEGLIELVKKYNELRSGVQEAKTRFEDFRKEIDSICIAIKEGRTVLKGSCEHCPKQSIIELFFG
jgi:hypothetical protein